MKSQLEGGIPSFVRRVDISSFYIREGGIGPGDPGCAVASLSVSADFDGILSEDEYRRLSNKFRSELTDITFEMEKLKQEKGEGIASAERLLELAQKASSLYVAAGFR